MGKMNDLFLEQIYHTGEHSGYSADELLDAWDDWWDNGYQLPKSQIRDPKYNHCFTLGGRLWGGLMDSALVLYALIRDNFSLKRPSSAQRRETDTLHLEEIEELSYRTGYPPNILLGIWLKCLENDPDWESFKRSTLALDW